MSLKDKFFRFIPLTTMIIINIILILFLIKVTIGFREPIVLAFVSFFGSIIGGALTLIGVNWTLLQGKRERLEDKYNLANYVFTELLPYNIELQNQIKSLNPLGRFADNLTKIEDVSKNLFQKSDSLLPTAVQIDTKLVRVLRSICWDANRIVEFIDYATDKGYTDQQIMEELYKRYKRIAQNDHDLEEVCWEIQKRINKLK